MDELYKYLISISPLQTETWNLIKELFVETSLKKGDYFIKEGLTAKSIGFLKNGVIRAFYRDTASPEYNKHIVISSIQEGGYTYLVTQMPNKTHLQALTDWQLLTANHNELITLYKDHHDFERFGRKLAEMFFVHNVEREVNIV